MKKHNKFFYGIGVCTFLTSLWACGVTDEGAWTARGGSGENNVNEETPVSAEIPSVAEGSGIDLYCQIPSKWSYPYLLEKASNMPFFRTDDSDVCLGSEDGHEGEEFCNWVARNEARYAAIADCYLRALQLLDEKGAQMVGSSQEWRDNKSAYVSGAWAISSDLATKDVGTLSGWINILMQGESSESVAATPFCFKKTTDSISDARNIIVFSLWWLVQAREAQETFILSALNRGVKVELLGNDPISVAVNIEEISPKLPLTNECEFKAVGIE